MGRVLFYEAHAGTYITNPELQGDALPFNNLQDNEWTWGSGLSLLTDAQAIEYSVAEDQFVLPPGWQTLSTPHDRLGPLPAVLHRKATYLAENGVDRSLSDLEKSNLTGLFVTTLDAIGEAEPSTLQQLLVDDASDELKTTLAGLSSDLSGGRLDSFFRVVKNGYQNEDVFHFVPTHPNFLLLEFCFTDRSEFFSLGWTRIDEQWKLSYARNGMSDL